MNYSVNDLNFLILNVGYAVHNGDWNWTNVRSPFTRLYYVTKGTAQVRTPSGLFTLTPGHLYLIPTFMLHDDIDESSFEHYYLHIYEDISSKKRVFEDYDFPFELDAGPLDLELFKRICELNPSSGLAQSNPASYDNDTTLLQNLKSVASRSQWVRVESRGILYQLLAKFLRDARPKEDFSDDRIQKVLSYIRKNLDKQISMSDLAALACLSQDHFIRTFKKEVGDTPLNYIMMRKMDRAQLLLATTGHSVKNVAYSLGYDDHSYFNRIFKAKVGMTPRQYMERTKK